MSFTLQGVQFRCDWCGVISEERPLAPSGIVVDTKLPDGWTGIGYGSAHSFERGIKLGNVFGSQISHLCPACSRRPTGDLLKFLGSMPDAVPSA